MIWYDKGIYRYLRTTSLKFTNDECQRQFSTIHFLKFTKPYSLKTLFSLLLLLFIIFILMKIFIKNMDFSAFSFIYNFIRNIACRIGEYCQGFLWRPKYRWITINTRIFMQIYCCRESNLNTGASNWAVTNRAILITFELFR